EQARHDRVGVVHQIRLYFCSLKGVASVVRVAPESFCRLKDSVLAAELVVASMWHWSPSSSTNTS
ncbi:MAG: hypothetical protein ACI855_002928, partial [Myxococcota bacterium]